MTMEYKRGIMGPVSNQSHWCSVSNPPMYTVDRTANPPVFETSGPQPCPKQNNSSPQTGISGFLGNVRDCAGDFWRLVTGMTFQRQPWDTSMPQQSVQYVTYNSPEQQYNSYPNPLWYPKESDLDYSSDSFHDLSCDKSDIMDHNNLHYYKYPSSMYKTNRNTTPLNPEAEEYIPKKYQGISSDFSMNNSEKNKPFGYTDLKRFNYSLEPITIMKDQDIKSNNKSSDAVNLPQSEMFCNDVVFNHSDCNTSFDDTCIAVETFQPHVTSEHGDSDNLNQLELTFQTAQSNITHELSSDCINGDEDIEIKSDKAVQKINQCDMDFQQLDEGVDEVDKGCISKQKMSECVNSIDIGECVQNGQEMIPVVLDVECCIQHDLSMNELQPEIETDLINPEIDEDLGETECESEDEESSSDEDSDEDEDLEDDESVVDFLHSEASSDALEDVLEHDDDSFIKFGSLSDSNADCHSRSNSFSIKFCESGEESETGESLDGNFNCHIFSSLRASPTTKSKVVSFIIGCDETDESEDDDEEDDDDEDYDDDITDKLCCDMFVDDSWDLFGGLIACTLTTSSIINNNDSCDQVDTINECNDSINLKKLNSIWEEEVVKDIVASSKPKRVNFVENPTVQMLHTWSFARRCARKGEWETYARDRARFKNRICSIEPTLSKVLEPSHRNKIFSKLFDENR